MSFISTYTPYLFANNSPDMFLSYSNSSWRKTEDVNELFKNDSLFHHSTT